MENERLNSKANGAKAHGNQGYYQWVKPIQQVIIYCENCLEIINKVGRIADIEHNKLDQIDIAHRTSKKKTAPIIILSYKKKWPTEFL